MHVKEFIAAIAESKRIRETMQVGKPGLNQDYSHVRDVSVAKDAARLNDTRKVSQKKAGQPELGSAPNQKPTAVVGKPGTNLDYMGRRSIPVASVHEAEEEKNDSWRDFPDIPDFLKRPSPAKDAKTENPEKAKPEEARLGEADLQISPMRQHPVDHQRMAVELFQNNHDRVGHAEYWRAVQLIKEYGMRIISHTGNTATYEGYRDGRPISVLLFKHHGKNQAMIGITERRIRDGDLFEFLGRIFNPKQLDRSKEPTFGSRMGMRTAPPGASASGGGAEVGTHADPGTGSVQGARGNLKMDPNRPGWPTGTETWAEPMHPGDVENPTVKMHQADIEPPGIAQALRALQSRNGKTQNVSLPKNEVQRVVDQLGMKPIANIKGALVYLTQHEGKTVRLVVYPDLAQSPFTVFNRNILEAEAFDIGLLRTMFEIHAPDAPTPIRNEPSHETPHTEIPFGKKPTAKVGRPKVAFDRPEWLDVDVKSIHEESNTEMDTWLGSISAKISEAIPPRAQPQGYTGSFGKFEQDEDPNCPQCGGPGVHLGTLGNREHFRCRNCGMDFSHHAQGNTDEYEPNPYYNDQRHMESIHENAPQKQLKRGPHVTAKDLAGRQYNLPNGQPSGTAFHGALAYWQGKGPMDDPYGYGQAAQKWRYGYKLAKKEDQEAQATAQANRANIQSQKMLDSRMGAVRSRWI